MATRTIVTAQPDVMCDVCERRLLRGEQPDVFLAAGRRRTVCELCAPRAAYEGWLRESDSQSLELPPMRPRRGRGLLERLRARQAARPTAQTGAALEADGAGLQAGPTREQTAQPYDALGDRSVSEEHAPNAHAHPSGYVYPEGHEHSDGRASSEEHPQAVAAPVAAATFTQAGSETAATPDPSLAYMQQAIAVFNASEFPRRVAGVSRSLGTPFVSVRCAEHLSSVVSIVVAWELCWYRYEVDLSEPTVQAQMIAQGTELAELAREDRLANAAAAESGLLALPGM